MHDLNHILLLFMFRVSSEMEQDDLCRSYEMWCDGLSTHDVDAMYPDAVPPTVGQPDDRDSLFIEGSADVMAKEVGGTWTFELRVPPEGWDGTSYIPDAIVPTENQTGWLTLDWEKRHIVIDPASAVECPRPSSDRGLGELIDVDDPGIVQVREWIDAATNPVEVLDGDAEAGRASLRALQVTSRSPLGAIALETGGILVDHGWVRVLGSGHSRVGRAIDRWNGAEGGSKARQPGALLIGDDVVGGFFALDGGALGEQIGQVHYFAPDRLAWEAVAPSYSAWLNWLFTGDLEGFFGVWRWPGWEAEVAQLDGNQGYSIYPGLCFDGPDVSERSRRPVPIEVLWRLHVVDWSDQLGRGDRRG